MCISLQMYRQIKPALVTLRLLYDFMTVPVWVLTCTLIGHILKPLRYMPYASRYLQGSYESSQKARVSSRAFYFPIPKGD